MALTDIDILNGEKFLHGTILTCMDTANQMRSEINSNTSLSPTEKGDKMRRLSLIITHLETAYLFVEKL